MYRASSRRLDDPTSRAEGRRPRAWYDNQRLFHGVGTALDRARGGRRARILLKGVPLVLQCYPEVGLRPMEDVDVLVEPGRAADAVAALEQAGWPSDSKRDRPWNLPYGEQMLHQVNCRSADGFPIDLHWRYVPWVARDGSGQDPGLWARARPLDVVGHHALSPSPDDLLLLVILHAFRAGWATAPRWIADTSYLVRTLGPRISTGIASWSARCTAISSSGARRTRVRAPSEFDVPVPLGTLSDLRTRQSAGGNTIATASRRAKSPVNGARGSASSTTRAPVGRAGA